MCVCVYIDMYNRALVHIDKLSYICDLLHVFGMREPLTILVPGKAESSDEPGEDRHLQQANGQIAGLIVLHFLCVCYYFKLFWI